MRDPISVNPERKGKIAVAIMLRVEQQPLEVYRRMSAEEQMQMIRGNDPMAIAPIAAVTAHEAIREQLASSHDSAVRGALALNPHIKGEMRVDITDELCTAFFKADVVTGDEMVGRLSKLIYLRLGYPTDYPFIGLAAPEDKHLDMAAHGEGKIIREANISLDLSFNPIMLEIFEGLLIPDNK